MQHFNFLLPASVSKLWGGNKRLGIHVPHCKLKPMTNSNNNNINNNNNNSNNSGDSDIKNGSITQ